MKLVRSRMEPGRTRMEICEIRMEQGRDQDGAR